MRFVQQMRSLAHEAERNPELLAEGIGPSGFGYRAKIRPQIVNRLDIRRTAGAEPDSRRANEPRLLND